jgi:hypothetical protein
MEETLKLKTIQIAAKMKFKAGAELRESAVN